VVELEDELELLLDVVEELLVAVVLARDVTTLLTDMA
jgi:hypothetical protein